MQNKDRKERKRRGKPAGDAPEIGVVRVFSNPGPDAPDRLRRLLSLMVRYATRDGQATRGESTFPDSSTPINHGEADD